MEEANAAATEDGAENETLSGDRASENSGSSSAEDTADRVGVFCCRDCGEAFREEAAYSEHRLQHPQENCGLYLDDRLNGLDSDAANFCTLCSLSFVELSEFQSHMEKSHGRSSQKESGMQRNSGTAKQHIYECADCGKSYGVLGHFLNHQRSHRPASKSVFNDLEHLKKKPFQCESCGRNYSRASALDAHRRCHEEKLVKSRSRNSGDSVHGDEAVAENQTDETEKLFKCSCGKGFTALLRLKTHQRFSRKSQCTPEEMKEKPKKSCNEFYCSQCDKAFSGHIALFNHQRWHTNHSDDSAKRFPCEECGKEFMTLTFYYRHQRTAHSNETPAKSFHHQVCQLQKKAFECKDCGLKFSRASALHSHELHHTDVFRETEKEAQMRVSLLPQQNTSEGEKVERLEEKVETENVPITIVVEDDETDEEMESYEPGDFNVQVISASESEDEPVQDPNPDLELLCESDQEGLSISSTSLVLKPEMDLKIIQIDFEPVEDECSQTDDKTTAERFDCPDCYRWFTNANSLRVHRMWHSIRKRRQQVPAKQESNNIVCQECGMKFTCLEFFTAHLHQHALREEEDDEEDEEAEMGDTWDPAEEKVSGGDLDNQDPDGGGNTSTSKLRQVHACTVCGKAYTYMSSFMKHLQLHEKPKIQPKSFHNMKQYECPECGMSFIRQARLLGHMRVHRKNEAPESDAPRCDQCNRYFRSVESWEAHVDYHKQNPFWCLSCAKGYRDEESLDRHLQNHDPKKFECDVCHKTFLLASHLTNHYSIHGETKPFQCSVCGKSFCHPGNLVAHRKKHLRCNPLAIKASADGEKETAKIFFPVRVKEEPETEMCSEISSQVKEVDAVKTESPGEDAEDQGFSDDSDCGEPMHSFNFSKPLVMPGSEPPDYIKTETAGSEAGSKTHREHKYWDWECTECDMGFDEVEKLHQHYIQHATGELPIPQFDMEG